tara:strand:- start:786 stop:1193 length:408 start_codon:yes stop_codon:yes gene_type:complete
VLNRSTFIYCFSLWILSSHLHSESISSFRCFELEGAKIIAEDGTFLGTLDNSYSSDSIFNQYSDFGKEYHSDSIWNEYSDWGNNYSSMSPFNEYASTPPILLKDGEVVGKLTVKAFEYDAVNPYTVGKDCGWASD